MYRKNKILICIVALVFMIVCSSTAIAADTIKSISVVVNPVSIKINGNSAKIDNFKYLDKIYIQPQDLCSLFQLEYRYDQKAKLVTINSKKAEKAVSLAKSKFASIKPMTLKSIKVTSNSIKIKINNKVLKGDNFIYNGAIYASAKDISDLLEKVYSLDSKTKILNISSKKPPTPLFAPDTLDNTIGNVRVTITGWGNAKSREYKIENGPWKKYTAPVVMTSNGIIYARGASADGTFSDVASMEVSNILRKLSVQEIAKQNNSVVQVNVYNKNEKLLSTGSGFVVSEDGKVVTNYHVVDMASSIEVVTGSNQAYEVEGVLDYSVEKDLAVLKLKDAGFLSCVEIGDSDGLNLGEEIVAISSPLGLKNTVTTGIVSSIRPDLNRKGYTDIQISAQIAPGSSGGALFNMYGQVVGVTYAGEGEADLNYAIPVKDLMPMLSAEKIKTLAEIENEVYPKMSYEEMGKWAYYNYYEYSSGNYDFKISDVYICEVKDDSTRLNVYLYQLPEDYKIIGNAQQDKNKAAVEEWLKGISEAVKKRFPDKKVDMGLCYPEYCETYPNAQDKNMVFYDKDIGKWAIFRYSVVYIYNEYGEYKFYWFNE